MKVTIFLPSRDFTLKDFSDRCPLIAEVLEKSCVKLNREVWSFTGDLTHKPPAIVVHNSTFSFPNSTAVRVASVCNASGHLYLYNSEIIFADRKPIVDSGEMKKFMAKWLERTRTLA